MEQNKAGKGNMYWTVKKEGNPLSLNQNLQRGGTEQVQKKGKKRGCFSKALTIFITDSAEDLEISFQKTSKGKKRTREYILD